MPDVEPRDTAADSLSQLLARILQQLTLSAWLPSAALVLVTAFIVQLGSILDSTRPGLKPSAPDSTYASVPGAAVGKAFSDIGQTGFGGLVLLLAAVVVVTMLTQAFAFEAIRTLEGYWGSLRLIELLATLSCWRYRWSYDRKYQRRARLQRKQWRKAEAVLNQRQVDLAATGEHVELTHEMIAALKVRAVGGQSPILAPAQQMIVDETDWRLYAPPDLFRREDNLTKRLRDYPSERDILPTKLGNVLRRYENATGVQPVEGLVDRVFHRLPFSLKIQHDEQRGRLDLYCSMSFLVPVLVGIAAIRFNSKHLAYTTWSVVIGVIATLFVYRAAVASARYYGGLLVEIARYDVEEGGPGDDQQEADPGA